MFFNCNWCRGCCCKREQSYNKPCHKDYDDGKDKCHEEKKCCNINQDYDNKDYCQCGRRFDSSKVSDNQDYNNFRYYDQYGSFDSFSSNNCKYNDRDDKNDKYDNKDDKHDKCDWDNKPSYNKCKPFKFICFPVDKC